MVDKPDDAAPNATPEQLEKVRSMHTAWEVVAHSSDLPGCAEHAVW